LSGFVSQVTTDGKSSERKYPITRMHYFVMPRASRVGFGVFITKRFSWMCMCGCIFSL